MPDVRLSRYQVMEAIGSGSQGQTFRGIDRANGSEVAIKVLSLRQLENWKGFDLFERECAVLSRLEHPGIPRFIDHYASESTGDYFLVMSLAPGRSLQVRREAGESFSPKRLRELLRQALDILSYLHERTPPVIHRDIKPGNLVLSDEGQLTLVDFGGVRAAMQVDGGSTMIGTFGYMAPEQLHGEASPATDIFALGATLVALATGEDPEDLPRDGLRIDLARVMPRHPLRPLLTRMLEPDPASRFRDARAVTKALASLDARPKGAAGAGRGEPRKRGPRAAPPRTSHQSTTALDKRDAALAELPTEIRELARTESPFLRTMVWLFAAIASGALTLVEAVFLPLFFSIAASFNRGDAAQRRLQSDREEALEGVRASRRTWRTLADETHPVDRG